MNAIAPVVNFRIGSKNNANESRKPRVMKPKSERDCPFIVNKNGIQKSTFPVTPLARWCEKEITKNNFEHLNKYGL